MSNQRCKEVKTRKPHECDQCKKVIPVGSWALNINGIWFGDADMPKQTFNDYYCTECCEENEEEQEILEIPL